MISRERAVEIAQLECQQKGWNDQLPYHAQCGREYVLWGRRRWFVVTNAESKGNNAYIHIDAETGQVTGAAFAPIVDPKNKKIAGLW